MKRLLLLIAFTGSFACHDHDKTSSSDYTSSKETNNESEENEQYSDGNYCATVTYHNPNTGTTSTYELSVEVEDGTLSVIHWPNGGWLDASHFTPEKIDEDGSVNFTSDCGYEYEVQLQEEGPCGRSERQIRVDDNKNEEDNDTQDEEE